MKKTIGHLILVVLLLLLLEACQKEKEMTTTALEFASTVLNQHSIERVISITETSTSVGFSATKMKETKVETTIMEDSKMSQTAKTENKTKIFDIDSLAIRNNAKTLQQNLDLPEQNAHEISKILDSIGVKEIIDFSGGNGTLIKDISGETYYFSIDSRTNTLSAVAKGGKNGKIIYFAGSGPLENFTTSE